MPPFLKNKNKNKTLQKCLGLTPRLGNGSPNSHTGRQNFVSFSLFFLLKKQKTK
jgi:hypothetical protein